ncbi:MAG: hypothetical protein ACXW6T_25235 [Candidatus Binatia bacterium]
MLDGDGFFQRLPGYPADLGLSFRDIGEIISQSPLAAHGYYKNPDTTAGSSYFDE